MNSKRRRGRVQNSASSSTISGSSVRAIFRTKDVVLLPASTESDVLRGERKRFMSHGFIRNELEIDKSWSKHGVISYLETCFSEKLSSVDPRWIQVSYSEAVVYRCSCSYTSSKINNLSKFAGKYLRVFRGQLSRQLSFVPINGQLTARGGGVEMAVRKSVMKPSATVFYMEIKTTFKNYFYNIDINLKLH